MRSSLNVAFTKHITNALMKIRDEKLKQKASVPKKLEDGWEPIIDMHVNGFDCHALCDLGASISIMPRKIYDMLDLPPLENCYYDVPIADVAKKKCDTPNLQQIQSARYVFHHNPRIIVVIYIT
jgi:hypothetical protein